MAVVHNPAGRYEGLLLLSSSSTKLPGEAPSTSTIRSQHAARAESGSIVQTYNEAVAARVLIVMDSGERCKCSSRVHPSGWGPLSCLLSRGLQIAVVPRGVSPTDSVYAPIVGHTFVY